MSSPMANGAFLTPRAILDSELWETKPAWWFKVWFYILANANFKDHNRKLKRGDLLTTYDFIYFRCNLARDGIKKNSIDNVLRHLKSTEHITTRKTTRGLIITVLKYDDLQDFNSYSNATENDTGKDEGTTEKRYDNETKDTKETYNNYPEKSLSSKKKYLGGEPQLSTEPQTKKNPQPEVVFRNQLKKKKLDLDSWLKDITDSELDEAGISRNTAAATEGIIYYIRKYKVSCGKNHPFYKPEQINDCMFGFLDGIWYIERSGLNLSMNEVIFKVIDRWFETTSNDPNNLRLSHFVGKYSSIFYNALTSVMADYGIYWNEDIDED